MFLSDSNHKKHAHCNKSPEESHLYYYFFRSSQMKLDFEIHKI